MNNTRICIVVPCYNEAERLNSGEFYKAVADWDNLDICFVNDGSSDNTMEVLGGIAAGMNGRATVLSLDRNSGKGEAVRRGINHILEGNEYDIVGYMDADLSAPFEEMMRLADIMQSDRSLQTVIGSRKRQGGAEIRRKAFRHYPGRIFAWIIQTVFRLNIYDTQCGAKVFRSALAANVFSEPFISKWLFDVELLLRIKKRYGLQALREVPLKKWVDGGDSRITFHDLLKMPGQIFRIYRRSRK